LKKKKALYISYDGMTDPLGQSQVINYLIGLTELGYEFDILSFEKAEKYAKLGSQIKKLLDINNINWYPQTFHYNPPIVSKVYDKLILVRTARKLHKKNNYDIIHCRSYAAAEAGLKLKRETGVKFLFDMRGFWADEKADGGAWNKKKWFWKQVYNFYKKKEIDFIKESDHIISLTEAGKKEIQTWPFYNKNTNISVIPCCADNNLFLLPSNQTKTAVRNSFKIGENDFVLGYLGSLGAWYMIEEMLMFYKLLKAKYINAKFLIVTNSSHNIVLDKLEIYKLKKEDIIITTVPFTEVPNNIIAADICISFIKPVYSKKSSSPVKIGEILSMGIPLIANAIGDMELLINENNIGSLIKEFTNENYLKAINEIEELKKISPKFIRQVSINMFSLEKGVEKYAKVYEKILQ
jgi:glycosyltransferase involved in cell wall biosynthesis